VNLSKLSAGDRVVVRIPVSRTEWEERPDAVDRVTQTQIVLMATKYRFWRRSGVLVARTDMDTRGRPYIVPRDVEPEDTIDEQDMRKMRQDVQAAAAVFEFEPSVINYQRLEALITHWHDVAYLPTRI
jgi:hypothetical protein